MSYQLGRVLLAVGAIAATVGFAILPWLFNQSGLQIAINYLSNGVKVEGILLWLIVLTIGGMFAAIPKRRLRVAALILLFEVAMYYALMSQSNGLFRAGGVNLLGAGFWCVVIGAVIHGVGGLLLKSAA